jgi:putative ABC transport system ATP-binding protein
MDLLGALHDAGVTIVVITHDRAIADRLPRRIEMLDGRIITDTALHVSTPTETFVHLDGPRSTGAGPQQ